MIDNTDIFKQINNSILDLQASDLQSYYTPLKKLGRLLNDPALQSYNSDLVEGLDLEKFLDQGHKSQGGMVGSATLPWSDDDREILGLQLLLILKFSEDPDFITQFSHTFYYSGNKIISGVHSVTRQLIIPFARDYKSYVLGETKAPMRVIPDLSNKVFIVHGHDGEARETVARYLSKIGFTPIILNEQANKGRTIIEKIENNSDVGFAVVLLTPDDLGKSKSADNLEPRARQNVLLELGYFMALLGRERVCALTRGTVEIPSDFAGVVWEKMDDSGGWKQKLARELSAAGHQIDWNDVMH